MKKPDLESTVAAGVIGAAAGLLIDVLFFGRVSSDQGCAPLSPNQAAVYGAVVGAGVQVGVRLLGVS